ncbi:folate family ECF transporter S component [Tissierella sp.]|uniref:folate family ECF transporter S component n=1 Tax=Tissierella sp. TaxID=41274 RepID=UPI0028571E53|nr:folate family ECF transporter S component [Tissierella sp.]MDR7857169.1 folate family ECF transporter S component [Tissierella sp.]
MNNFSNGKISTKTLVQAGFLVALSIVLTRFLAIMVPVAGLPSTLRLSFGEIPLMISGLLFGPIIGGISGLAADLIGVVVLPQGPYFPGFTLSSILWGVIPGIFSFYFKRKGQGKNPFSFKNVFLVVCVSILVISIGLNTYWLSIMLGKGYMILLPGRAISAFVNIPIQSYIIATLIKYLKTMIVYQ